MEFLLYALAGALIAAIGSMAGVGGGVFLVPLLYYMGLHIEKAVGTSLFIVMFTSISATTVYWRKGVLKPRVWASLALLLVPTSMVGAEMASIAPRAVIKTIVAIIIIAFGINLLLRSSGLGLNTSFYRGPWIAPLTAIVAGFIAGLSGIGGGAIITPTLISVFNIPVHEAVAASHLSIISTSTSGSIVHIANGNVIFNLAIPFAIGAFIGAQIGGLLAVKSKPRTLSIIIGLVVITIGILTLLK